MAGWSAGYQLVANYTDMDPEVASNTPAPVTEGSLIDSAFPRAFNGFAKYTIREGPCLGCMRHWV
jgi:outer membrane receptor for monomeric catechols